ncbi:MAG TPA: SDR family oxidoreductase, partial [Candidatus Lokiarchaeia archaeon]
MGYLSRKGTIMNILITGHRGMIGSRLYEYLKKEDRYSVDGIDIVDGSGDILTFQFNKIYNIVIHCAALTSVVDSIKYPDKYYKTNVLGSNNIIKQCTNSKLIFFSTSAVYGEGLNHSEISPYKPPCPYAKNKVAVEAIIKNTLKNW